MQQATEHNAATTQEAAILEVTGLSRKFKRKYALEDVTLAVPRGVVFGLVGENGAGKTTLLRHLLGMLRPTAGQVRVFDRDPIEAPVEVLSRIGFLSEERDLPGWMTVQELMRYTQAFYPDWDEDYAEALRDHFALDPHSKIKHLSRGEQAKTGLLVALAYRPELLMLDEPSAGLDPVARRDILEAIVRTVAEEGRTVIFSSHLLDEIERVSDQVAMIHEGKLIFQGALDAIKANHQALDLTHPSEGGQRPDWTGVLYARQDGAVWTVICSGSAQETADAAQSRGWTITEQRTPSLEELFIARVRGGKDRGIMP